MSFSGVLTPERDPKKEQRSGFEWSKLGAFPEKDLVLMVP